MRLPLLVVLPKHSFKLLLLFTVFVNLRRELADKLLDLVLKLFDFRLLKVEELALVSLRLILIDLVWLHLEDASTQILQSWLLQRHLLSAVALLFLELDRRLLLLAWGSHLACSHVHVLHDTTDNRLSHILLLGHGWLRLELVMDGLDDAS